MKPEHLQIEAGHHASPGGQQVSVTSPAVRVTHLPTGLIAESRSERSQGRNKAVALSMLEFGLAEIGWSDAGGDA